MPEAEGERSDASGTYECLIELSEADSNITQPLGGHFGFTGDAVNKPEGESHKRWTKRIARGEIARTEMAKPGKMPSRRVFRRRATSCWSMAGNVTLKAK